VIPPLDDHPYGERHNMLRPDWRTVVGALIGGLAAILTSLLGGLVNELLPFVGLLVPVVALVALLLGAAASMYAFATSGLLIVLLTLLPLGTQVTGLGAGIRLAAFVLGAPLVVLVALRAERERQRTVDARNIASAAERRSQAERAVAERARRDLNVALRAAERERAQLAEVAEAIPEPLMVYDAEARGRYGNRAALRVFGRSFFERSLDEWGRTADPRDEAGRSLPRDEWPQVAAQQQPVRRRITVRLPMSGRDLIVDVEGTPIPGGGCVLLLRDVGKEEEERRRLSRFASFVAHELRNPLAVAKARIELGQREEGLPPRAAVHARRAMESVDAAIGILERLDLFSRADAGQVHAQLERLDLAAAIESALERLRARGSERKVALRMRGRPQVIGDRHLTEQAITNLLTNADRYSDAAAPIRVEVSGSDPLILRVIDNGPGITDDVADHLFRDRVSAGRGLGLGLYLVNAVMQAQGGSVQLEQRRPRAVFALRWRRAPNERPSPPA